MPISHLSIRDFSAFSKAEFAFSPGLNVIIGANSTGKSHLMKLLYAGQRVAHLTTRGSLSQEHLVQRLSEKLAGVFTPGEGQLGQLVRRPAGRRKARVSIQADEGALSFQLSGSGQLEVKERTWAPTRPAVFLPSHELLALYEGFTAAHEEREFGFDETYRDACKALAASPLRGARGTQAARLLAPLEKALGGQVRLVGTRFYVELGGEEFEARLVAEGLRKIASLAWLVANGSLAAKGTLFWDEPEAHLSPRLIVQLSDFLLDLARRGTQVFLASHDQLLTQRLSLAAEYPARRSPVPMRFFSLYRDGVGSVQVESAPTLAQIEHNPILQEYAQRYDAEAEAFFQSMQVHEPEDR
jgi:hypothetical protein